jgi:hypothetical protein
MECIDHLKPKEALEIERAKQKAPKC